MSGTKSFVPQERGISMRKKEWFYKAATCIASAALILTALPVISASAATSVKGTSHVTQFGEYDIEVTVGVEDQKISSLLAEGKNYAGNYVSDNQLRLEMAAEVLEEAYLGKSTADAKEIGAVDIVSGATYSSKAIRDAILDALGLEPEQEENVLPTEKLKEGTYTVTISYYTDKIKHSLIEDETRQATIQVDADGNMTLTTDIVSGSEKEPLYIYQFDGYYADNNVTKTLKTDADVTTETMSYKDGSETKEINVVSKVSFPLEHGFADTYSSKASIYVPTMKRLTGTYQGITFDQGKFSADCFTKVYWNTLKAQDEAIEDGVYDVPVALMSASNPDKASMAGAAIAPTVRVTVKGGKAQYKLNFHSMDINMAGSTEKGHLEKFWVYEGDNKSSRAEAMPGDSYTEEGVSYPGSFSFERAKAGEKSVYARVSVDAMAGFDQDVLLTFDWAKRKEVNDDHTDGNGNNNNNSENNDANSGNGNQQYPANGNSSTGNQNNSSVKAPAAVKNLKKKKGKKNTLTLSWKKVTDANGYEVYQATKAKGKYKKIKTISKAKTTKLTVKKLKAKKTYYFKVRAYKKNGKQKLFGTYSKVLKVKM